MISDSAVSASWGGQITTQALIALAVFLVLVTIFLAFYFERAMAVAALVALLHDVVVTAGHLLDRRVRGHPVHGDRPADHPRASRSTTPSWCSTRSRRTPAGLLGLTRRTYAEAANLALNQTLMRSINTSLIAVLPVVGLMVIGVGLLGVGTLADLALVQMVGILVGALSSLLLATPLLVDLKMRDRALRRARGPGGRAGAPGRRHRRAAVRRPPEAAPAGRGRRPGPDRRRRAGHRAAPGAGDGGRGRRPGPHGQGHVAGRARGPAARQVGAADRQAAPVSGTGSPSTRTPIPGWPGRPS